MDVTYVSLRTRSARWAGSQLDQASLHGVLDHFSDTALSGSLCRCPWNPGVATSVCQKMQPWSSRCSGKDWPVRCSWGSRLALGHWYLRDGSTVPLCCCHAQNMSMLLAMPRAAAETHHLQTPWRKISGWRSRSPQTSLPVPLVTVKSPPSSQWPSAEAEPWCRPPPASLCACARGPPGRLALRDVLCRWWPAGTRQRCRGRPNTVRWEESWHGWWRHQVWLGNYYHCAQK